MDVDFIVRIFAEGTGSFRVFMNITPCAGTRDRCSGDGTSSKMDSAPRV